MKNTQVQGQGERREGENAGGRLLTREEMELLDLDVEILNATNPDTLYEIFKKLGKNKPLEGQEKKTGQEINLLEPYCRKGRRWLPIEYQGRVISFSYPPVKGDYQACFKAIGKDKELKPAEGIELALLTYGAYTGKDEWKDVKKTCFQSNFTRAPNRHLWLPKGTIKEDKSLSGVLVERNLKGKGASTKMEVPSDLSKWKEQNGIYTLGDLTFVPKDMYKLGEMGENDGFARANLSEEGVPIFIKTARDAKLIPYNLGTNVNDISEPVQRVALLDECGGRLNLDGDYSWSDYSNDRAFGVFVAGEASTRKKIQELK